MALAMSMVAHGDGGTEAGAVLGFLDLCHPTSYEIGMFHNMEKELIFYAESIGESALRHAAFKEVEKSLSIQESGFDFERWKQAVSARTSRIPKICTPELELLMTWAGTKGARGREETLTAVIALP